MSARVRERLAAAGGFTMIEVMFSMVLLIFTLGAISVVYFEFLNGGSTSDAAIHAENTDRAVVDQLSASLRTAAPTTTAAGVAQSTAITHAGATDVVFNSTDWPGASGTAGATAGGAHVLRYCVDPSTQNLYFDGLYTYVAASADPGSNCPSTVSGWTHSVVAGPGITGDGNNSPVVNSATTPLFTYDSATLSSILSVGVNLAVTSTANATTSTTTLPSAATPRARSVTAVPTTGPTNTCNADGTGVLTLGATTDTNGNPLVATATDTVGGSTINIGTGTSFSFGRGGSATPVTHTFNLTVTNIDGLTTSISKTVTC